MSSVTAPRTSPGLLRQCVGVWRREGARSFAMRALAAGLHRRLLVLERDTAIDLPFPPPEVEIELGRVADPMELRALRPDVPRSRIERHLAAGAQLLGARHAGRLVSARWISFELADLPYLDRALQLAPNECYAADSFTAPAFRRHRVNGALSQLSQELAREAGARVCIASVLPENEIAVKAILRYGYRATGYVGWTGIGPLRRYFARRDGAPLRWAPR